MDMSSLALDMKSSAAPLSQPMDSAEAASSEFKISSRAKEPITKPEKCLRTSNNPPKHERIASSENVSQNSIQKDLREAHACLEKLALSDTTKQSQCNAEPAPAGTLAQDDQNKSSSTFTAKAPSGIGQVQTSDAGEIDHQVDEGHPEIVVSKTESLEASTDEQSELSALLDGPDPRLVIALENPRDRLFVLKLEQDVISFIVSASREFMDTPPINSYHRMLAHKIAEFYRLTHVSSTESADIVRLYRGLAARIPPVKLVDTKIPNKTPSDTPPPGPQLAMKIMRRTPSERCSEAGSEKSASSKPTPDAQSTDTSKPVTREEREAAYQLARARIFGDFKESPPESPSPAKTPNERPQSKPREEDDGFQSRSQFVTIPSTYSAFEVQRNRWPAAPPVAPPIAAPVAAQFPGPATIPQHVTHNLNPSASSYIPGQPFQPPERMYQYPMGQLPRQVGASPVSYLNSGYPSYPSQLPPPQTFLPPQHYTRNFLPGPAPTQPMSLPSAPIYPFGSTPNFTPGLNNRTSPMPPMGSHYGPNPVVPMNNHARPNTGFDKFPQDQMNINSYPQPNQPVFGGMSGGWRMHDGNSFHNRAIVPTETGLTNANPGVFGVGSRT